MILRRLTHYLLSSPLLHRHQFGFIPNRGVISIITVIHWQIAITRARRHWTYMISLDLEGAYDSINQQALLAKLHQIGVSGRLLKWYRFYLRLNFSSSMERSTVISSGLPSWRTAGNSFSSNPIYYLLNGHLDNHPARNSMLHLRGRLFHPREWVKSGENTKEITSSVFSNRTLADRMEPTNLNNKK